MTRVAWFYRGDLTLRNACRYQRLLAVAQRHRVTLFTKGSVKITPELQQHLAGVQRSPSSRFPSLEGLLFVVFAFWHFWRSHRRDPYQVLWTPPDQALVIGFLLNALLRRKAFWVADMWDDPRIVLSSSRTSLRYWLTRVFSLFTRSTLRYADLVVAVGATLEDGLPKVLREEFGVRPSKMVVVTNGVDLEMFRPTGKPRDEGGFRVLYVGFMGRAHHGVGVLLEATAKLRDVLPGVRLVLAGPPVDEVEKAWLVRSIGDYDLDGCARYLGPQPSEKIPSLVEEADVCVYPFLPGTGFSNVLPIKVYEYLAMGRCVVASDLQGVRNIVREGENGLLVLPGDAEALAGAILRLSSDQELRAHLEANARKSIEHADWARINETVLQSVEVLVGASKQGVPSAS